MGNKILRCPQHDSAVTHTASWINLFICIIAPIANLSALDGYSDIYMKKLKSIIAPLQIIK